MIGRKKGEAMDILWAPWRSAYINTAHTRHRCIFCAAGKKRSDDAVHQVIRRSRHSFVMLNRYPYNNGHVMVAPYRHSGSLERLTAIERADLMQLLVETQTLLAKKLKPHGFNIGMNVGRIAGAGFAGHLHMHIVPRWAGDTNFMPVVGNTKVISYSLEELYQCLRSR